MTIRYVDAVSEQLPATDTTIYTAPSGVESAHVVFGNCTNEDAVDTTLTINVVQSGGAVAVTNRYFPPKTITAGSTDSLSAIVNCVLKPGDFISAVAADAARLNLKLGIKEII